jgi:hypothetical protein
MEKEGSELKKIFIILFFLIPLVVSGTALTSSDDEQMKFKGFNLALTKCERIVNAKQSESMSVALKLWLGGYFTALNSLLDGKRDVTGG